MENNTVYIGMEKGDEQPLVISDSKEKILELVDEYYGATEEHGFTGKRTSLEFIEYSEHEGDHYATLQYEMTLGDNITVFIWAKPFNKVW